MNNHFGIVFYVFWWGGWLIISNFELASVDAPSFFIQAVYLSSIFLIVLGYVSSQVINKKKATSKKIFESFLTRKYVQKIIEMIIIICIFFLVFSLKANGAFLLSFTEYYTLVRGVGSEGYLPGGSLITYSLKMIMYPMLITILLFSLTEIEAKKTKVYIFSIVICLGMFSYFFQVNYPIILLLLLFFLSMFNPTIQENVLKSYRKKVFIVLILIICLIVISAFNRFGDNDLLGVVRHYLISYHTLGFKIFEYNYFLDESILHKHTFGLSFFGTFDFIIAYLFKLFGLGEMYTSAIMENVSYNMTPVPVGDKSSNAFGTYLFTYYRDFGFVGIILFSWLYGFVLGTLNRNSIKGYRVSYMLYLYLLSMGVIGIYVSPLDYSYFWLVILMVFFIKNKFIILPKVV